jgi:predicted  nucleic acid-binding Zn-ribbon protein
MNSESSLLTKNFVKDLTKLDRKYEKSQRKNKELKGESKMLKHDFKQLSLKKQQLEGMLVDQREYFDRQLSNINVCLQDLEGQNQELLRQAYGLEQTVAQLTEQNQSLSHELYKANLVVHDERESAVRAITDLKKKLKVKVSDKKVLLEQMKALS